MLFRSLIERMTRSNANLNDSNLHVEDFGRGSFEALPGLLDLVLASLRSFSTNSPEGQLELVSKKAEILIFPMLDLLRKLIIPFSAFRELRSLVMNALGDKHWHVRDMAARILSSTLSLPDLKSQFEHLFISFSIYTSNELHGRLMSARYCFLNMDQTQLEGREGTSNPDWGILDD